MRRPGKKAAIAALIVVGLSALPFLLVPLLLDADKVGRQLQAVFKQQTGYDLVIEDGGHAQIGLSATIEFRKLRIAAPTGSVETNLLAMEKAVIHAGFFSALFTDAPKIFAIELKGPHASVEISSDGRQNWHDGVNAAPSVAYHLLQAFDFTGQLEKLSVEQGVLQLNDRATKRVSRTEDISFTLRYARAVTSTEGEGHFKTGGRPYQFTAMWSRANENASTIDIALKQAASQARVKGTLDSIRFSGNVAVSTDDAWPWLALGFGWMPRENEKAALAFSFNGDIDYSPDEILLKQASLLLGKSQGNAVMRFVRKDSQKAASAKLAFAMLDLDSAMALYHSYADYQKATVSRQPGEALPLFPDLLAAVEFNTAQAFYQGRSVKDLIGKMELRSRQLLVPEFSFDAPGASRVTGAAQLLENSDGISIDGSYDAEGKSLRDLFSNWAWIENLPVSYQAYKAKFRLLLSATEARLYEARLQAGETGIAGTLLFDRSETPSVSAALGLKALDLDALYHSLFPQRDMALEQGKATLKIPDFGWLKTFPVPWSAHMRLDDFSFLGRKGKSATLQLSIDKDHVKITDLSANLDDMNFAGSVSLNTQNPKPALQAYIVTDRIGTAEIMPLTGFPAKLAALPAPLDSAQLQFPYLTAFTGNMKLQATELEFAGALFKNASLEATLDDNALTVNSLKSELWDGKINLTAQVGLGTIPTFASSLTLSDVEMKEAMRFIGGWNNYQGRASTTIALATSGIDYVRWKSGLNGNIAVAATDVTVGGFDINALVNNAASVRTVSDIQNVVKSNALANATTFTRMEGNWPIQNAVISPSSVMLSNPAADGKLIGSYALLTGHMDMAAQFALKTLSPVSPPVLSVVMKGQGTSPAVTFDTRALEAYVAQRSAREMLDQR